jgi:hypothetical protein
MKKWAIIFDYMNNEKNAKSPVLYTFKTKREAVDFLTADLGCKQLGVRNMYYNHENGTEADYLLMKLNDKGEINRAELPHYREMTKADYDAWVHDSTADTRIIWDTRR